MQELSFQETQAVNGGIIPVIVILGVSVGMDVLAGAAIGLGAGTLGGLWAAKEILN